MPLAITIDLLTGSYDAGDPEDRRRCEWPPHPARLFCALVAAARTESERDALRWLEAQEPPLVQGAELVDERHAATYVVTNELVSSGGSQSHVGRSNQLRERSRAVPANPRVRFIWHAAATDDELRDRLDALCRRIPYLGRSTGVVLVAASAQVPAGETGGEDDQASTVVMEPCDQPDGEWMLRVPYCGYLDQLDDLYAADRPAWQAGRYLYYRTVRPEPGAGQVTPVAEPSVYRDVVVLQLQGIRPHGRLTAEFTSQLRRDVLRAAGDQAPAALHGHGADGRPHVAFLALPDVAWREHDPSRRADGHLLGLAVAVPDLPAAERRAVLAAVLGLRRRGEGGELDTVDLEVPRIGTVQLRYDPGLVRPWGATPERWRRGSTRWASATPVVLDRFPKRGETTESVLRASIRQVGLPEPVDVTISTAPTVSGAVAMRPADLPPKFGRRLFRHVTLTFEQPVAGPVMVGAGRYLGIGLFAPLRDGDPTVAGLAGEPASEQIR